MQRRHFEAIAAALKRNKADRALVRNVAAVCQQFNSSFMRDRFYEACGLDFGGEEDMRKITIELKYDCDSEEKETIVRDVARTAAKHLKTSVMLISDLVDPEIAMRGENFFEGPYEIELAEDLT